MRKQNNPKYGVEPILNLVMQDLKYRAAVGEKKYGEPLRSFNGRSAVQDALEEAYDLSMYLRQKLEEDEAVMTIVKDIEADAENMADPKEGEYHVGFYHGVKAVRLALEDYL